MKWVSRAVHNERAVVHPSAKGVMARNRVSIRQQYTKLSLVSHSMISRLLLVGVEDDLSGCRSNRLWSSINILHQFAGTQN